MSRAQGAQEPPSAFIWGRKFFSLLLRAIKRYTLKDALSCAQYAPVILVADSSSYCTFLKKQFSQLLTRIICPHKGFTYQKNINLIIKHQLHIIFSMNTGLCYQNMIFIHHA